jgi:hypothetical protein
MNIVLRPINRTVSDRSIGSTYNVKFDTILYRMTLEEEFNPNNKLRLIVA